MLLAAICQTAGVFQWNIVYVVPNTPVSVDILDEGVYKPYIFVNFVSFCFE